LDTIELAAQAGANVFVAGTAIYGTVDPRRAVEDLRTAAQRAATVARSQFR
jgi:ribulose-phosphate 3-epimerase